jgi:aspartyl-tRNA(Asn)/glutamyl-tRNA(Gln) amidotransferase subunit C
MEIDKKLIDKIAKVSRLNLTESEVKEFIPELKEVLENFSKLSKVNTKDVKPSFQPIEVKNVLREDKIEKCVSQEDALKNSKHKKDGYFVGPRAI